MLKKFFGAFLLLLVISGSWFFFAKDQDFSVHFKTEVAPGIIYNKLDSWEFKKIELLEKWEKKPFERIEQKIEVEHVPFLLTWNLSSNNNSETVVKVKATNLDPSFQNHLNSLLGTDKFQEAIEQEIFQLKRTLKKDAESYRVTIEGKSTSPAITCACISLENKVDQKAFEMMATINHLSDFVLQNKLETNGRPRVHVTMWNLENHFIKFDFCFPVNLEDEFPTHPIIFFKKIPSLPSIKATYNGNYMFSHYAWMELLDYAEHNNIEVPTMPLEIFHNNPEYGGNPLNWKAEIFLPVK